MKKRWLSWLLCVCLLLPCCGVTVGQVSAADNAENYIVHTFSLRFSENMVLGSTGVIATKSETVDAIDLTQYEYTADPDRLAIQVDVYAEGDDLFWSFIEAGALRGQMEITSSGVCDKEEIGIAPGKAFAFERGVWKRVLVPLSEFTDRNGLGEFRPSSFNYFRIYLEDSCAAAFAGSTGVIKLHNFLLVDTAAEPISEEELPVGDGSFVADPPVFKKMEITAGFNQDTAVFAGYNLQEYLDTHPDLSVLNPKGEKDYSSVVNSLLDGLAKVGGGALFIPAGEWDFRREIFVPDGTSIIGEWVSPDKNPEACGTIFKVYCGKGSVNGAFITMGQHTMVQNLSFWYPEQTAENFISYPPTIDLNQYTFAKNITLYNSYFGIRSLTTANCPNAWNVYGTPLNIGLDFDMVIDIARIEEIHFSPDYWIESELEGAPTTAEEIAALEDQLYNYAIAITLRRIDWSYVTYSDIEGYNIALMFAQSIDGNWPNGQCVGLTFTDCKYGHFAYGVAAQSESLLDITMQNCEYGVYITSAGEGSMIYDGAIRYFDVEIDADKYAVYQESDMQQFNMLASTVYNGRVYTKSGCNIFINNQFLTPAPQVELDYGTVSGVVIGNTDAYGDPIVCVNPGRCAYTYEETPIPMDDYEKMTREEAAARVVGPASDNCRIPTDLDLSGKTDMTEKIQGYLSELGANGGGTLFLMPGRYRIEGTLSVPTGVELRGAADFATIPKALNTILQVYTPAETVEEAYNATATVTLAESSGIRGVIFNYPDQNQTWHEGEKVLDPIVSAETGIDTYVQYYEFDFIPYPYAMRGTGKDVYVVNVTVRNGWNGVDFMTHRCDNHYIDYLAGHFFNRGMVVGNGAVGGYIRNYQFNYNSIMVNSGTWSGWGGLPNDSGEIKVRDFHQPLQAQFQKDSIILQLGHVEDQLVYNCFNYMSYIGVHLIAEESGAADVRIFGHGVDAGAVSVKIEAAEHVEFTNLQLTSFNNCGDDANTERWTVDQTVNPLYNIWVTDTFEGEFSVFNFAEWAQSPNSGVRVDGGTINLYNAQISHSVTPLFELHENGRANVYAFTSPRQDTPVVATGSLENLHITAGFYYSELKDADKLGTYADMYPYAREYAVPKNVIFTEDSEAVFMQSFDNYELSETAVITASNLKNTSVRRGAIRARLNANDMMQSIYAGKDQYAEMPFALESGKTNDLYRMEWRVTIDEMRDTEDSEIYLYLTNANVRIQNVLTIKRDGSVYDQNGTRIGQIAIGTYYRFAVEVDARNADSKTVTVYLLNDDSRVIGKGSTTKLNANFQGENTVTGFQLASMAMFGEGIGTETDMSLDYFYIIRSEKSTIGRNVAEG
ncbi:MAG: hypothetical protein E7552_04620, partial [Ruminococcaceae bacterium]|nr:hypothetical protein [Oscillospiraceae bacterium]